MTSPYRYPVRSFRQYRHPDTGEQLNYWCGYCGRRVQPGDEWRNTRGAACCPDCRKVLRDHGRHVERPILKVTI